MTRYCAFFALSSDPSHDLGMTPKRQNIRFLASVRTVAEARLCVTAGADVIDCKNPDAGALGALPHAVVRAIRQAVPENCLVSATIGDLVPDPIVLVSAAAQMAATGVDYVKIGFFPGGDARGAIGALSALTCSGSKTGTKIVGLLLADREPDFNLIGRMADAGFSGVMLDTAGKQSGALTGVLPRAQLREFIAAAHDAGLFAGLAGSLRLRHIPSLIELEADLLGFRGALCRAGDRKGELDPEAVQAVRDAIPAADGPLACDAQGRQKVLS